MNYFTLDGHRTTEWGIGLSAGGAYDAPARKGESISVPGRNGNIWVDDGSFENVMVTYPCWMSEDFDANIDDFRAFLSLHSDQYYELRDTYHPNEYRLARYAGPFTATPGTRNKSGRMDVTFDCMPQRFLNAGYTWRELEIPDIDPSQTVATLFSEENPTGFSCAPVLMAELNENALFEFSVRNDEHGTYANIHIGDTTTRAVVGTCYYIDLQNFIMREGTTANDPNWESLPVSSVPLLISFPEWDSSNGQALFLEGVNVVNNRTIPHTRLEKVSILTRYWTI